MSTISYLASLVNQVIGRQNAIESNAKKVDELPHQNTLEPTSKLPVSRDGVSEHITVQQIISSIQNSNYNKLLSVGAITVEGTDIIVERGVSGQINGLLYTTSTDTTIPITLCASGFNRKDILVLTTSNTVIAISGEETDGAIVLAPTTPTTGAIYITEFDVSDSAIGTPIDPILGTSFKKKSENLEYSYPILKGTRAVIQLRPEGHSYYSLESSLLVSVDGFGTSLITGVSTAETPYPMKDLFIENKGTTPFTLLHNGTGSANSKFFFLDETDLVVPPGGKVWLKYGGTYCQLFLTSWNNGIPTFQQVTQSGNTTEEVIEAAGYRSRGSANVSGISFNDGDLNDIANLRSEATSENVMTYILPNDNGTVALREWVYNIFASKENSRQYNYAFSETIDSIRLDLPATESYLIIDTLIQSINGFNVSFSDLYDGKDYFIYNNSSDEITLKHNADNTAYDFNFKKGVNIKIPRRGVLHLKFIGGKFIDVIPSWIDYNELQPYLDTKQDKAFSIKVTTPSSIVTGSVSEVEVLKVTIPPNSLSLNEIINMPLLVLTKTGTAGTCEIRVKISTASTMPFGNTDAIARYSSGASNLFVKMQRDFIIDNGTIKVYPLSSNVIDNTTSASVILTKSFDPTVTNYLYVSIQQSATGDSSVLQGFYLTNQ
ncbi:MAG: hypothetical protein RSE15_04740 [Flavobacterium sp.]|uniref:hypothetical protein n=1 Tax=Flavobacterium sp. TaxID=239 RepID=UPI002B486DC4|nr:hypothetical protein [Flavobacterium sp.]WRH74136.1 MAG: hypothetical protein RSE15_04740 [Flavobacterium sp.]